MGAPESGRLRFGFLRTRFPPTIPSSRRNSRASASVGPVAGRCGRPSSGPAPDRLTSRSTACRARQGEALMSKVVRIHQLGGPDVLQLEDLEIGAPGAGEVRLRVEAI